MSVELLPPYPALRLDHLARLTDDTGIIQHALYSVPDLTHGYSIDDQARALIVTLGHARLTGAQPPRSAYTYLGYLRLAANSDGSFHNFLSYSREWLDERGSDDAQGRALWALGYAMRHGGEPLVCAAASTLFTAALPSIRRLGSPRTWACALFGLYHRQLHNPDPALLALVEELADRLVGVFQATATPEWCWFEDRLTYCNGKLPAALLLAYELAGDGRYREVGLQALAWLCGELFTAGGELRLVGQDGWYVRGGQKAAFDEQCVDAQGTVEAALIALRVTGQGVWQERALAAFAWFWGRNVQQLALVDPLTWGCYDGLRETGLNRNMGAESILTYLLAYLDLVDAGLLSLDGALVGYGSQDGRSRCIIAAHTDGREHNPAARP